MTISPRTAKSPCMEHYQGKVLLGAGFYHSASNFPTKLHTSDAPYPYHQLSSIFRPDKLRQWSVTAAILSDLALARILNSESKLYSWKIIYIKFWFSEKWTTKYISAWIEDMGSLTTILLRTGYEVHTNCSVIFNL